MKQPLSDLLSATGRLRISSGGLSLRLDLFGWLLCFQKKYVLLFETRILEDRTPRYGMLASGEFTA
jgi:hypothetical protein